MNDDEDNDPLWKLLGEARPAKVSPFFARDVLRAVRNDRPNARFASFAWIASHRRLAAALGSLCVGATIVAVAISQTESSHRADAPPTVPVVRIVENPDYEVIADLDMLLASEGDSLWQENSAAF